MVNCDAEVQILTVMSTFKIRSVACDQNLTVDNQNNNAVTLRRPDDTDKFQVCSR